MTPPTKLPLSKSRHERNNKAIVYAACDVTTRTIPTSIEINNGVTNKVTAYMTHQTTRVIPVCNARGNATCIVSTSTGGDNCRRSVFKHRDVITLVQSLNSILRNGS